MKNIHVAVTGAAGQIGYALLFRLASGEVFGPEVDVTLQLIEIPEALGAAQGVIMELQDCAFPRLKKAIATSDLQQGFAGADWALLVGSVPRRAGMERSDLLTVNGGIFVEQGKAIDQQANPGCKVLVVGNPCNTNAFIAKDACQRIPKENFFALTMLDQNRATAQLALKAGVPFEDVKNVAIWGNHSSTQYPDFYQATIQGRPAVDVIGNEQWLKTAFLDSVRRRGAAIIEARGKSSAASAANAVIETVRKLSVPTPSGEFFSVAVCSDGSYGIERGLIFSFPVRVQDGCWEIVQDLPLNAFVHEQLRQTEQELLNERAIIQKFFL